jgi:hypothetical protein
MHQGRLLDRNESFRSQIDDLSGNQNTKYNLMPKVVYRVLRPLPP